MRNVLFLLLFVCCFTKIRPQLEGDSCTANGIEGVCTSIQNCPEALKNIREKKPVERCGFEGSIPIVCCIKKSISQKKCVEYHSDNKRTNPNNMPAPPGIIGGVPTAIKETPHMVALGFGDKIDKQWLCGAALISTNYVLTAAHCLFTRDYGEVKYALMGTINLRTPALGGEPQMFEIKRAIRHPDYKRSKKYHDIALLELNDHVRLSGFVKPICLYDNFEIPLNVDLIATGWGKTDFSGSPSYELLKVDLKKTNHSFCNEQYDDNLPGLDNGIVDAVHFCAGSDGEVKDTCQGDSGGPLHFTNGKLQYLVGITSFGRACGLAHTPGVYTRVSNYLKWIEDTVWN